jgi:16S rRNA G966 N2-methylase RsmD
MYIPSITRENNILQQLENKYFYRLLPILKRNIRRETIISTNCSTFCSDVISNNMDYIFIDPPFGANLMYSELNFIWEAWLRIITNNKTEAIINKTHLKALSEYQMLMQASFTEFYRVLKPGHWMTVEFHNSQNAIWNAIQEALQQARFVIADVRVLDKQQGTFKQVTSTAAVKQDLIISAYKPNDNLEERFKLKAGTEEGVWEFVRYHLDKLPVVNLFKGALAVNAERQAFLLFDRMVAFHVQRGVMVPISAAEFYAGWRSAFTPRWHLLLADTKL